jgi:G:T-mismatch repair DNA endonuclease (very short patch repair protein)
MTANDITPGSSKKFWWKCDVADDHEWVSNVANRTYSGNGCPCCSGKKVSVTNSLETLFPDVADQWHLTRNGDLTPADVVAGSDKRIWWKCDVADDHQWQTSVANRTSGDTDCPFCSHQRLSVTNSLKALAPDVAAQWHPTRNGDLTPADVVAGGLKKFWWKCDVADDHEWQSTVDNRVRGLRGCSCCAGKKVSVTNSLETLFPDVAAQWHPTRNGDVVPAEMVAGSSKKFWWKCDVADDHEWKAQLVSRTSGGTGCPDCTLTPRSAQEMRLAHELKALIDFDLDTHKLRLGSRLRDVDIVLDELRLAVEFDGAYWHRNKADKDLNKTRQLEEAGWKVIRVRERPLESIHENDVMVAPLAPAKDVADLVLAKIVEVTGVEISGLDEYLASDRPRREAEALAAIRAYLKDQVAKKAERAAKKAERSRESEG